MPKNRMFRQTEVDAIVQLIRAWPTETIRWQEVCIKAALILGFVPSRQGLTQRDAILQAFQSKKKNLTLAPKVGSPIPSSLAVAAKRIGILNTEIAELKAVNMRFRDLFQIWQYNAHLKGMTEADLSKPLPSIDREVGEAGLGTQRK